MSLVYIVLAAGLAILIIFGVSRVITEWEAKDKIVAPENAPDAPVAIVFGAGLTRDGRPTPVLRDRVKTAANLYFSGKVRKILMSGDNRFVEYNEPAAMRSYALSLGVPDTDIVLDYAGRRTYDTCYRAGAIFGVTQALLITQRFHLPRAVFLCRALGMQGIGVIADQRPYSRFERKIWKIREIPASLMAIWDVWVRKPLPVLGDPEPIFPVSQQAAESKCSTVKERC